MTESQSRTDSWLKLAQTVSIVVGVVFSVMSIFAARERESLARQTEAQATLIKLRQERYVDVGKTVAKLMSRDIESEEYMHAKDRFREFYIVELTMVESPEVAAKMVELATAVDPTLLAPDPKKDKAIALAKALQKSFSGDAEMQQFRP